MPSSEDNLGHHINARECVTTLCKTTQLRHCRIVAKVRNIECLGAMNTPTSQRRCPLFSYTMCQASSAEFFCEVCERPFTYHHYNRPWLMRLDACFDRMNQWMLAHLYGGWTLAGNNQWPYLTLIRVADLDSHWRSYLARRAAARANSPATRTTR